MLFFRYNLLLVLILVSSTTYGMKPSSEGGHTQGGGGGVYCENNGIKKLVTLDFYEAKNRSNNDSVLPYWNNDFLAIPETVDENPNRIDRNNDLGDELDAKLYKVIEALPMLNDNIASMDSLNTLLNQEDEDLDLKEYEDSGREFNFPPECHYVQLIVREGTTFKYNTKMIGKLNGAQFTLLALHESIYWAAKSKGKNIDDSRIVRQILIKILEIAFPRNEKFNPIFRYPTNSHAAYGELCDLAHDAGLCDSVITGTPLQKDLYSLVFQDFYEAVTQPLNDALMDYVNFAPESLITVVKNIQTSGSLELDKFKLSQLRSEAETQRDGSGNKILTVHEILKTFKLFRFKSSKCYRLNHDTIIKACENFGDAFFVSRTRATEGFKLRYLIVGATGNQNLFVDITIPPLVPRDLVKDPQINTYKFYDHTDFDLYSSAVYPPNYLYARPELTGFKQRLNFPEIPPPSQR